MARTAYTVWLTPLFISCNEVYMPPIDHYTSAHCVCNYNNNNYEHVRARLRTGTQVD